MAFPAARIEPLPPVSPLSAPFRRPRGLTLIEVCAVLAVVALVATMAAPSLQALVDTRRLDGAATQLGTDLQLVRSEAVSRNLALRLTFFSNAAGSCYVLHTGNAADCRCDGSGRAQCQGTAEAIKTTQLVVADRVTLASNARSLLFDPVHGTSTPTATLRVLGTQGREIRHVVNVMGRVRSCSPDAAVKGYAPC